MIKKSSQNHQEKVGNGFWLSALAKNPSRIFSPSTLYLLLLFFLPTQLGKHFWPEDAYVLGLRVDYLSPTLYMTDILLVLLFCFFVIKVMYVKKKRFHISSPSKTAIFFLIVFICLCFGVFFSTRPLEGIIGLVRLGEVIFFGYYTWYFFKTQKYALQWVTVVFLANLFLESILAITQFVVQTSVGGFWYLLGERRLSSITPGAAVANINGELLLRPYGTFSHPNTLAGYIVLVTIFLTYSVPAVFKKNRVLALSLLGISTLTLLLTLSRVALVVGLVFFIWYFLVRKKYFQSKKISKKVLLVLIGMVIVLYLFLPTMLYRFSLTELVGSTLADRLLLNSIALQMFLDHPFLGVGLEHFLILLPSYLGVFKSSLLQPAHNIFLLIAAETGIMGLLGFCFLLYRAVKSQTKRSYFQPGVIMLIAVLLLGMTDHYFITQQQGRLMLGFVLGFCFSPTSIHKPLDKKYSKE